MENKQFNDIVIFPRCTLHNGVEIDKNGESEETTDSQDILVTGSNQKDCENDNDIHITDDDTSSSDW